MSLFLFMLIINLLFYLIIVLPEHYLVLTTCTLGGTKDNQLMDDLTDEQTKRYIHHYNFPPYSVGEARAPRSPGRREIGHGALAERALVPVLPSLEEFPYTIRCVSEVLSSNGSTSQASICGSTLALMDAGVPIKAPVAGISCGLITEGDRVYQSDAERIRKLSTIIRQTSYDLSNQFSQFCLVRRQRAIALPDH